MQRDPAAVSAKVYELMQQDDRRELVPPELSDDALAAEFARRHGDNLRFVNAWGKWLRWDGRRWAEDRTTAVFDLIRTICREGAATAERNSLARQVASAKTVAAVEKLARCDQRLAVVPEAFNVDAFLLNTPGGTVDLRDGILRPHRREDLITAITQVTPDHDADDSTWLSFLHDITCGAPELQNYLQRLFGYCLTGDTRDHVLPFFCGVGANGKSTFLDLFLRILLTYARQVPTETLLESRGDRHPTEIANLMGVRLAISSEVEEGQHWAESRIKSLTGDAVLSGRFMRQDFFTFARTHKLVVSGNHKPSIRVVDDAMRRRIHIVPFDAQFLGSGADRDMPVKLGAQGPAVLAWAIRGCLEWQVTGLNPPAAILGATSDYMREQDMIGQWLIECCQPADATAKTRSSKLYESFRSWKDHRGEGTISQRRFSMQLGTRFQKQNDVENYPVFIGVRLK